ncbi:uncharacterized protein KIAA2012 homolog isoform X3 [Patiria miniata]|uniref:Uncharacterized protein n=1 Tax=Patiria miniata TaxID=46514 RepID=A0A913ZBS6_PATMI|nr:uncharacterized protein KIAA2012 homolog isoform X3 [Patiria miniata]
MATTNTGLSLLARGIGEERVRRGHKKLEVSLEPEDYHNIQGRKYYLPPIQQRAWPQEELDSPRELHTHKTFTTRKGALLLYSEDLAMTAKERADNNKALEAEDTLNLNTFHDLRSAILSYGAKDSSSEPIYLGFVHNKHAHSTPRAVRPGFSAKRYLSNWSRSWDDSILNTLRNNGHILDKNLFQENALAPRILRRINDDLSSLPAPYRVTRNMLMAPGSPVVYEFYRIRPSSADSGRPSEDDYENEKDDRRTPLVSFNIPGSIAAVIRDEQNKPRAVPYASLAPDEQQQVLQRLLLQSAMHKQLLEAAEKTGQERGSNTSLAGSRPVTVEQLKQLNMGNAIAALVDTNTSGLLQGQQVFDDKGFKELYKKRFGQQNEPSPPSIRKGLNRSDHRSNIPTVPTLPPILSSSTNLKPAERQTLKLDTKLPQITMEPPTPQHPVLSQNTQSRQSSSWEQGSEEFRESWPSDETNIWKADIDEDELLKQQQAASEEEDDAEDAREEEIHQSETKTKSARSSKSFGHQRSPSKGSILSSVSVSMEDLTGPIVSGGSKHPSGSEKSYGGSSSDAARSIKGSQLPGSLRESMRSYKGGRNSNTGSVVMGPDGEVLSIGGGVGSGADAGSSVADVTDNLQASSMAHSTHMGELESLDERDELEDDDTLSQDSGHMSSEEVEVHEPAPTPQPVTIPTAQFGEDLPESKPPSLPSVPQSKATKSQKSVEESIHSGRDITGGDLDATRSFANFSYGSVGRDSVAEDALSQDGIVTPAILITDDHGEREPAAEDEVMSEQEPDWPTEFGETSEPAEEDAVMEELEDEHVQEVNQEEEISATESVKDDIASQRAPSQLEELEEQAAAVAAIVLERPKSGRDLAEDAQIAADLWMKKLGELFNLSGDPERVRSAMIRRRRNSLDASSVASSTEYGRWSGPKLKKSPTKKSRRMNRVHSAEAAVHFLENLIKGDEEGEPVLDDDHTLDDIIIKVAQANEKVEIAPDVIEMLAEPEPIQPEDIMVIEDTEDGKLRVLSRAGSSRSVRSRQSMLSAGSVRSRLSVHSRKSAPSARSAKSAHSRKSVESKRSSRSAELPRSIPSATSSSGSYDHHAFNVEPPSDKEDEDKKTVGKSSEDATDAAEEVLDGKDNTEETGVAEDAHSEKTTSKHESEQEKEESRSEATLDEKTLSEEVSEKDASPPQEAKSEKRTPTPEEQPPRPPTENVVEKEENSGDATENVSVHSGKTGKSVNSAKSPSRAESAPSVKSDKSAAVKSTPSVKGDAGGPLEFGVTNYGVADKKEQEKEAPIVRPPAETAKPQEQSTEDDELAKLLKETGLMEKAADAKSSKSGKSSKSSKSNKSNGGKEKNKEEFVVKKPADDKVDYLPYKPLAEKKPEETKAEPAKATKAKKPKKPSAAKKAAPAKKSKKKPKAEAAKEEPKPPQEEPVKTEEKVEETKKDEDVKLPEALAATEPFEDEEFEEEEEVEEEKPESPEFIIIHDEFSDSEEEEEPEPLPPSVAQTDMTADSVSIYTENFKPQQQEAPLDLVTHDSASQGPSSVSRSQAKAAKRAAEAERRKQAVERKRREREEAKRKQQEEAERQEQLKRDFEEEKRRKEEAVRLKREREAQELERRRQEEEDRKRQSAVAAEREKKKMEEYKRKMEELARQKRLEDDRRRDENWKKEREEEERRKAEDAKLAAMAEEERLEYQRQKREEELIAQRLAEEERLKRELLAKLAQEEAERVALELAKRQKEMERRLMFNKALQSESNILSHSQDMTPAFTWSYYELLEFLGLAMPDFLKKHQSFTDTGS